MKLQQNNKPSPSLLASRICVFLCPKRLLIPSIIITVLISLILSESTTTTNAFVTPRIISVLSPVQNQSIHTTRTHPFLNLNRHHQQQKHHSRKFHHQHYVINKDNDSESQVGDNDHNNDNENEQMNGSTSPSTFNILIVGSGWAGYTIAESISQNQSIQINTNTSNTNDKNNPQQSTKDIKITLLDASPNSGGLAGGFKTRTGRNVEAGIHGFWREYQNTFSIMDRIEGVEIDNVLGDYVPSVLYSKNGRVALAPVLGDDDDDDDDDDFNNDNDQDNRNKPKPQQFLEEVMLSNPILKPQSMGNGLLLPQMALLNKYLPPPLDIALLAKFNPSSPLSPTDRLSALGLLGPWIDFQQESSTSWSIYDQYSARVLFQEKAGITKTLYEEMIEPLLSVLPMCPDYDCSAAAVLSCFHVFALQSKGAFDVKWCRGSIREKIFDPWSKQLSSRGVEIRYNSRVTAVEEVKHQNGEAKNDMDSKKYCIKLQTKSGTETAVECDAVVFAVGGTAMGRITSNSPALKKLQTVQERDNFEKLRGVTCVAVRLFLQPAEKITSGLEGGEYKKTRLPPDLAEAMKDSPVAVCGPNPLIGDGLMSETGFCIYDLQRMHDEFSVDSSNNKDNGNDTVAVLEVDFYRADEFVNMNDEEIAKLALETVAKTFKTKEISVDKIIDVSVVRARNAVSHFAPKSASYSPDVKLGDGIYICGDWVDRSGHASWSTEKAVVTGIQCATRLSEDFNMKNTYSKVIEAAKDTEQLGNLREVAKKLRTVAPPPGGGIPPSPWMLAREILSSS